ncbi:MAG: hypothetical protein GTO13_05450 [Proteobacteria bacterium]|nr:hypothetical protein [Pseudomonadota bacterium]
MKRRIILALVAVVLLSLSSVSFAGDRQRGRWEGVAIGLGAITLYNLFHHGYPLPVIPPHGIYERHISYPPPVLHRPSGHWEIRREWVPERRERIWIPGHYEDGYWVKGHYEVRIFPGYYVERELWVEDDPPYERRSRAGEGPPAWAPAHGYPAKY